MKIRNAVVAAIALSAVAPVFAEDITWSFEGVLQYANLSTEGPSSDPLGFVGKSFSGSVTFDNQLPLTGTWPTFNHGFGPPYGFNIQVEGHSFSTTTTASYLEVFLSPPYVQMVGGDGSVDGIDHSLLQAVMLTTGLNDTIPNNPADLEPLSNPDERVIHWMTKADPFGYQGNFSFQGNITFLSNGLTGNWPNPLVGNQGDPGIPSPIPEPETYAMMLAGLGLLGIARRRKLNG